MARKPAIKQPSLFDAPEASTPQPIRYCQTCGIQLAVEVGSIAWMYSRCEPCQSLYFQISKMWMPPEQLAEMRRHYHDCFLFDRLTGRRWTDRRMLYLKTSIVGWGGIYDAERVLNGRQFARQPHTGEFWYLLNELLSFERRQWLEQHPSIQAFLDESYE